VKVVLIGGSGFIGRFAADTLLAQGHEVAVFHRGQRQTDLLSNIRHFQGDWRNLLTLRTEFREFGPEVVIDFILSSGRQAQETMDTFRGIANRVVALSSGDVYRAAGVVHGAESGPLEPVPLTEESDLRTHGQLYSKEAIAALRKIVPWLDESYDKIAVERIVMKDPEIAGMILRLPMVYGPGDRAHRLRPYLKRMDDGRPAILIQNDVAQWRVPRGYVENVAAGIVMAATFPRAPSRIYNIAEAESFSELQWVQKIGDSVGWSGAVLPIPPDLTPEHLRVSCNSAQHLTMSSARIREELGYAETVSLGTALARTIEWERANVLEQLDPSQFNYSAEDEALGRLRNHFAG
jgi:nucleoside-diphosphate-sugar epimerase